MSPVFALIFVALFAHSALAQKSLLSGDYLLAFLEGAKINQYIQGSLECAILLRDSQYDFVHIQDYF
jgi:hypothetical protein